jgi:NAD(P)-dependent dehydrogenase (short-subunit alcohol dehydrogenase family)
MDCGKNWHWTHSRSSSTLEETSRRRPNVSLDLNGSRILVIGGGSGIARAIAVAAHRAGATLVLAGRDKTRLDETAELVGGAETATVDLGDEATVSALAESVGAVDHVISTAGAAANGPVRELGAHAVQRAFDAKVIGPILLAKHLTVRGSFLFFSGVVGWRPAPGRVVMATANGALGHLVEALSVELAPVRVNAISPGIVDSGLWDGMGERKAEFLDGVAASVPARRFGTADDIAEAALFALTNRFTTGAVLHVDGGGRWA